MQFYLPGKLALTFSREGDMVGACMVVGAYPVDYGINFIQSDEKKEITKEERQRKKGRRKKLVNKEI